MADFSANPIAFFGQPNLKALRSYFAERSFSVFNDPEKDRKSTQERSGSRPGWRQGSEDHERRGDSNGDVEADRERRPDESVDEEES